MNRQQARERVVTTLTALATYALVAEGGVRRFQGLSPVAIVLSEGMRWERLTNSRTHDLNNIKVGLTVYVRCDEGGEAAAEDSLDQLMEAAAAALNTAGFIVGESNAAPDDSPLRNIDGIFYRLDHLRLVYEEFL